MAVAPWIPWLADALVLLGLAVMTIGVVGIVRMPDIFTKQHAASNSVFRGVCSIHLAVAISGGSAFAARALLIGALLIITTPVAAHEIARAAAKEFGMRSSGHHDRKRVDPRGVKTVIPAKRGGVLSPRAKNLVVRNGVGDDPKCFTSLCMTR